MYQEFFVKSPLLALPIVALVIFIVAFASIVVRAMRRDATAAARDASLPLGSEEVRHG